MSVVYPPQIPPEQWPCYACGRGPTAIVSVSRNLGMVLIRSEQNFEGPLCRDHGSQLATNWLIATSLMGWWGLVSFFVNFVVIARDVRALWTARGLGPAGSVLVPGSFGLAGADQAMPLPTVPRRLLAVIAGGIVLVVVGLIINARYGPVGVASLSVGDCFNMPPAQETPSDVLSRVSYRPCTEAHEAEVFAVVNYPGSAGATYPTEAGFQGIAERQCGPAFVAYTGGQIVDVAVIVYFLAPTSDAWASGDRRFVCYLGAPAGQPLTHSLRAAAHT